MTAPALLLAATRAVIEGDHLPANDEVFDLAEQVAKDVAALHAYVTSVRSAPQADAAVHELLSTLIGEAR